MAYKLDNTGRYVDSSGKKYDAASGWTASKDGKTLTNSYTGQTVTDAGSTKSSALSSTGTSNTVTKTASSSKKTSPRQVTYTSGSKSTGSSANTNTAVTNANAAIANTSTPQMTWTVNQKPASNTTATPQVNWTVNPETAQVNVPAQQIPADDNYVANPALKGILSQNAAPDHIGGVFLELGDMGKSQPQMAYSLDGSQYEINTAKGLSFLHDAKPGESIVGNDGARFTKNEDGSMTVYKDGKTYIYGAGMMTGIYPEEFEYTPFDQTEMGQTLMQDYQQLMDKIQNYDPFTYDPNTDPLYLQYADSYTRGGQRAMTDILGQLAARTGGMASSYAGSMAQQTYDQYMADLAAKIPELQQLAYSMYMDRYNRDVGNYDRAYTQFADAYNRYGQDTQFRYNQYQDDLANRWKNMLNTQDMYRQGREEYNAAQQWNAQQAANERANRIEDDEIAYRREQDRLEREDRLAEQAANRADALSERIYDMVLNDGYRPTPEDKTRYGLTDSEYYNLVQYANDWWRSKSDKWAIF